MDIKKHILITGTGRTGTTFLVELFTNLGFDTGFNTQDIKEQKFEIARAGLEYDLRLDGCPYVVKDPAFCDYADEVFSNTSISIEHIFIPIRNLQGAVESRKTVTEATKKTSLKNKFRSFLGLKQHIPGGLWQTSNHKEQEIILLNKLYSLMLSVSNTTTAITLIKYPRSTKDASYLFQKLESVLNNISFEKFSEVYQKTVQPDLVHSFNKDDK